MKNVPISENLKTMRKERGLTQAQLADLAQVDVVQISRIERDESKPALETLKKLAIGLNCSTDELIFETGEREPPEDMRLLMNRVSHLPQAKKQLIQEILLAIVQREEYKTLLAWKPMATIETKPDEAKTIGYVIKDEDGRYWSHETKKWIAIKKPDETVLFNDAQGAEQNGPELTNPYDRLPPIYEVAEHKGMYWFKEINRYAIWEK